MRLRPPTSSAVVDLASGSTVPALFGTIRAVVGPERALVLHYRTSLLP